MELKETQEFGESKITKRTFDVSMEQVMVDNLRMRDRRTRHRYLLYACAVWQLYCFTLALTLQGDSFVSVVQFHLHGWPKEGVPSSPDMMLDLVHLSRQHWRETGFNLITVHTATK